MLDSVSPSQATGSNQPGVRPESDAVADLSWESELFVLQGENRENLRQNILDLRAFLERSPQVALKDLAATLAHELQPHRCRLAIVAGSRADLLKRLDRAAERLADSRTRWIKDSAGIYFFSEPLYRQGHLVLLFPGEGAQYLNMLADLLPHFPEVRHTFAEADRQQPITPTFLVPATATAEERAEIEKRLRSLEYSISSVLLANLGLYSILHRLHTPIAAVGGHSAGELTALWVSGCLDPKQLSLKQVVATMASLEKPSELSPAAGADPQTLLLAVGASRSALTGLIQELKVGSSVFVAMDNCPHQCVLVGDFQATAQLESALQARGLVSERLPFHRPYHTPRFEEFMEPLRRTFDHAEFHAPAVPVYCCTTGRRFPDDPTAVRELTLAHWTSPVEFTRMVQSMYADGARLFVETGPRGNLTAFVEDILRGQPVAAVAANVARRNGITQLNHLAGQLIAHEVPLRLGYFYERRDPHFVAWHGHPSAGSSRGARPGQAEVMNSYLAVMEDFLRLQQEMTEHYLTHRRVSREQQRPEDEASQERQPQEHSVLSTPVAEDSPSPPSWIMLGQILQHDPGQELVARRELHLDEDLYANHHSLGGSEVSRVDPDQHGSPVLPMTFSLETMAEAAKVLFPHLQVIGVENVRLHRWIAFEEGVPTILEIRARALPATAAEPAQGVSVSLLDCGHSTENPKTPRVTAEATVLLTADYPATPAPEVVLAEARPCRISREFLYRSMFHGATFRGVEATDRITATEIEGIIRVPARETWFRSTPSPALLLDPVVMDMTMHVLAAWHLEQPDQSGRVLLPFKLDRIEFFAPIPGPGARLISRARTDQETARHVRHRIEVLDEQGRLVYRMLGAWYWRFYLPFQGNLNFHSPKDEYFLSAQWPEAQPAPAACCMYVEPPADLQQPLLQAAMARVTSTPEELRLYAELPNHAMRRIEWLFTRLAAKDAVRMLWYHQRGQRLMPADLALDLSPSGRGSIRPRHPASQDVFPPTCVARDGSKMAALASFEGRPGIALASLPGEPELADLGDAEEQRWLERFGPDRAETLLRFACARQAVVQALAPELPAAAAGVAIRGGDPSTGLVLVALGPALVEAFPEYRLDLLRVQTARRQNVVVATTLCQRAES